MHIIPCLNAALCTPLSPSTPPCADFSLKSAHCTLIVWLWLSDGRTLGARLGHTVGKSHHHDGVREEGAGHRTSLGQAICGLWAVGWTCLLYIQKCCKVCFSMLEIRLWISDAVLTSSRNELSLPAPFVLLLTVSVALFFFFNSYPVVWLLICF